MSSPYPSLADRLIANSYLDVETECWIWLGARNPTSDYPRLTMRLPGRRHPVPVYAHRLALKLFAGRLSPKHEVHHRCRNPRCINPDHLEATTKKIHRKRHQVLKAADGGKA